MNKGAAEAKATERRTAHYGRVNKAKAVMRGASGGLPLNGVPNKRVEIRRAAGRAMS
jgi:hypothetical protein